MSNKTAIYCCGCESPVIARLTDGKEIYPTRPDLANLPYWKCDICGNYVGCHHKNPRNRIKPLGCIPTRRIRRARQKIHKVLDPIWQNKLTSRTKLYKLVAKRLGKKTFHTGSIQSMEEADQVYEVVLKLSEEFLAKTS